MFDLHVHAAPDVVERAGDDVQTLRWYQEAGFTGCVLKAHYDATAGRAHAASQGLGMRVYGGLALNQQVGGINPAAVEAALAMGARVIWMPTADAHTQQSAGMPRLCSASNGLAATTYAIPPIDWSVADAVQQILTFIADADAVLATGHLSTAEVRWLLPAARRAGVRRVLLTHPSYTVPAMSPTAAAELTTQGAYAEVTAYNCFTNPTATQPASRSSSVRSATTAPSCPPTPGNPTAPTHRRPCSSSSTHSPARDSTPTHSLRAPRKSPNASSHPDPAGQMIANIRIRVDPDDLGHQLTSTPGTRPDSAS